MSTDAAGDADPEDAAAESDGDGHSEAFVRTCERLVERILDGEIEPQPAASRTTTTRTGR